MQLNILYHDIPFLSNTQIDEKLDTYVKSIENDEKAKKETE
jgi:hypothetical protein